MENEYINHKLEIEKLTKELRSIFEKNDIRQKLEKNNKKMLESNFWQDKSISQKIIKEKNCMKI